MLDFLQDFSKNGLPTAALWIIGGGLGLYLLAAVWTHLSIERLFWQNLFGSNRVALPRLARLLNVQSTGADAVDKSGKVFVIVRPGEANVERLELDRGIIYPVTGRNGIHFAPSRCSSCGLCAYVCPTKAITTQDSDKGYLRRFDLTACIYCGMCEGACPTQAIKLTINQEAIQAQATKMLVQAEVEAAPCPKCQRKAPRPDLLAERIYNFELPSEKDQDGEDGEELTAFEKERRQTFLERGKLVVQPEAACPECQKRVLAAEEEICK